MKLVRVKGCGKSAPRRWQHSAARQTPPGARPNREVARKGSACPRVLPGRPLEVAGDGDPRGMIVLDRTRLTGRLPFFSCACVWLPAFGRARAMRDPAGDHLR